MSFWEKGLIEHEKKLKNLFWLGQKYSIWGFRQINKGRRAILITNQLISKMRTKYFSEYNLVSKETNEFVFNPNQTIKFYIRYSVRMESNNAGEGTRYGR